MKLTRTRLATTVALATLFTTLGASSVAHAADVADDPTFTPNTTDDLVGVGSDTTQHVLHLLAEGDGTTKGFNDARTSGRLASFAALPNSTKIVLREGRGEINRPNGSGAGKGLLYGANDNPDVSYARSSSAINATEKANLLQAFPFAVDGLRMAVSTKATNAPASLTAAQVVSIYKGDVTNWNQVGGRNGVIKPYIPQAGSGTRIYFEDRLKAANGGTAVNVAGVATTQEHSDAQIKDDPNAVVPFSTGRAKSTPTVSLVNGYAESRALYNVVRGPDASKSAFLSVFGSDGFLCGADGKKLIEAAGFSQLARPSAGGVCGQATSDATTNLVTADGQRSTTTLRATATPDGTVRLTATVQPGAAEGKVTFFQGDTKLGDAVEVDTNGRAVKTLEKVAAGEEKSYRASFAPTDAQAFSTSEAQTSAAVPVTKYAGRPAVDAPSGAWGATRTVTVTVAEGDARGTGEVTFNHGDAAEQRATLSAGRATFAVPATTAVGTYWGAVDYAGDANFQGGYRLVKFTVSKASTRSTLSISPTKVKVKKSGKATVTVVVTGSSLKPAGTVTLKIGSTTVGTGKVVNGRASVTLKAQTTTGKKSVKATFTPSSGNYAGSTSATATYTVLK